MKSAISKNGKAETERVRKELVDEIDGAWASLQASLEQIRRRHYYRLGELFIQLRMTFQTDQAFGKFCSKQWRSIKPGSRLEYMVYRKKLGKVSPHTAVRDFPPLRRVTAPDYNVNEQRGQYQRIVDDEVEEPTRFEVERQAKEDENDLIVELAEKIISTGFRTLAVKLHPDKDGGSNDAMRRLNKAKKLLDDALLSAAVRF